MFETKYTLRVVCQAPNHDHRGALHIGPAPASPAEPIFTRPESHLVFPGLVTLAVLAGLLTGLPPALVAAVGAATLLMHPRYPSKFKYEEVHWSLLVFFVGLFLIVGGARDSGLAQQLFSTTLITSGCCWQ